MNDHTKRTSRTKQVTVGAVALLGAGALTGALLIGNSAGADPIEGDDAIGGVVGTPSPAHDDGADERLEWVTEAVLKLDDHKANDEQVAAKKNEDHLVVRVDEERIDPDASGRVSYCYNDLLPAKADYPEPALSNTPGSEVCDGQGVTPFPNGEVIVKDVTVNPTVRAEGGPAALSFQTAHLDGDGVVITVFDRDGNVVTNPVVVTVQATYKYAPAA